MDRLRDSALGKKHPPTILLQPHSLLQRGQRGSPGCPQPCLTLAPWQGSARAVFCSWSLCFWGEKTLGRVWVAWRSQLKSGG